MTALSSRQTSTGPQDLLARSAEAMGDPGTPRDAGSKTVRALGNQGPERANARYSGVLVSWLHTALMATRGAN